MLMQILLSAAFPHLLSAATAHRKIDELSYTCHFSYNGILSLLTDLLVTHAMGGVVKKGRPLFIHGK